MYQYYIVNATALDQSGASSILRQFVENIPVDDSKWLLFVSPDTSINTNNPNVRIEPVEGVKPMYKRLWWDVFGLKKWLKRNDIQPVAAISLQNTGFNVSKKVTQYIYYHQSLPFYPYKWNLLKKKERTFWFYKNIYPFFVKLFLHENTKIFVQLNFIKECFAKRYKHPIHNIAVFHPSCQKPTVSSKNSEYSHSLSLCYPAMGHFYKNHRVIVEALKSLDRSVKVIFTTERSKDFEGDKRIINIGIQPFEKICELYYKCDAMIFPSYIETYGLPLLEAAMTGLPIIAADLPYAREVLEDYEGVTFVQYSDPKAWIRAIQNLEKGKRYTPIDISNRPGWKNLFKTITTN